jgi:hypothetical protein
MLCGHVVESYGSELIQGALTATISTAMAASPLEIALRT